MRPSLVRLTCSLAFSALAVPALAQSPVTEPDTAFTDFKTIVSRLELEKYKATVKGLTRFGDRREGTERNRKALDWIEAQLKSYGCTNTERITYQYAPAVRAPRPAAAPGATPAAPAAPGAPGTPPAARAASTASANAQGGGKLRGNRARTGVNSDSMAQKDPVLRALNSEPSKPGDRQDVYCTKIGTTHPEEMYIVGAHMDGHGWGEAANDDGSGTALVMELARIFSNPDVKTDRSIRFVLWNNEETGLNGARAYVDQRQSLQGIENPKGSGKYPEPKWLGMIQHDMMMWDHGMPNADGSIPKDQRPEADVNIEFQMKSKATLASQQLAWFLHGSNEKYATDYPAQVGPHMTNTDSAPFQDLIPTVSLRENERGSQVGAGWDPNWHQVSDVFSTYSDKDFRLGLNAAQTTLGALLHLANGSLKKP